MELLQVRVDKETKERAAAIFESMGMDLSTAVRVFLRKVILTNGIPFWISVEETRIKAKMALEEMRRISEANGNCNMTLEEINEEIAAARRERKRKDE
ncbi:MAG: type II toxin-antitoxin system RelB/DinJ family antitoxin [Erysipelotrichaceae bacterium]|jgi:DNA-damage-inducible protein J|nr:type II toxin-antitoxin system RelB/DinJ family antitoxin [Erysipelotrichaceae bacterium]